MYTRSMYAGRRRTRAGRRVERANASRAPTPSDARAKEDVGRGGGVGGGGVGVGDVAGRRGRGGRRRVLIAVVHVGKAEGRAPVVGGEGFAARFAETGAVVVDAVVGVGNSRASARELERVVRASGPDGVGGAREEGDRAHLPALGGSDGVVGFTRGARDAAVDGGAAGENAVRADWTRRARLGARRRVIPGRARRARVPGASSGRSRGTVCARSRG